MSNVAIVFFCLAGLCALPIVFTMLYCWFKEATRLLLVALNMRTVDNVLNAAVYWAVSLSLIGAICLCIGKYLK